MNGLANALGTLTDLALVIGGFTLIIIFHELGHFLACKWAGIRVMAFAVGFGPALVSFRKGLGWRRGSSEPEYLRLREAAASGTTTIEGTTSLRVADISPTEYRLNVLPFGGYVKPLGQDDLNPGAMSLEPDSFHAAPVWKRMVMISAGVVMNIIIAAILFVIVFSVGLRTEPPKVGMVLPKAPAAVAVALNAAEFGVTQPGLKPGDIVRSIDGRTPNSFNDLVLAAVMAEKGQPLDVRIERPGVTPTGQTLRFLVEPREDKFTHLLAIGVGPLFSGTLANPAGSDHGHLLDLFQREGLNGLQPGMKLTSVGGKPSESPYDLTAAVTSTNGSPVSATFADDSGRTAEVQIEPTPELQTAEFEGASEDLRVAGQHLLGLMPAMRVRSLDEKSAPTSKLRPGDVFVQIGASEWPSVPEGISLVRAHAGKSLRIVVERAPEGGGQPAEVDLGDLPVSSDGKLGFYFESSARLSTRLAAWPRSSGQSSGNTVFAAQSLGLAPGSKILAVDGRKVASLVELQTSLRAATQAAFDSHSREAKVPLTVELPIRAAGSSPHIEELSWTLTRDDLASLHALGWESPLDISLFQPEQFLLRADSLSGALKMGVEETRRVMLSTYVTFVRLFQRTVRVEHLKGPVGIAHIGTILADRGFVWLLFYMALISVNLAVVNFLPIPIADGGHFVYLLYEQITGRPVSAAVQNFAAIVGVIAIGAIFLIVTFNDFVNLFKG